MGSQGYGEGPLGSCSADTECRDMLAELCVCTCPGPSIVLGALRALMCHRDLELESQVMWSSAAGKTTRV